VECVRDSAAFLTRDADFFLIVFGGARLTLRHTLKLNSRQFWSGAVILLALMATLVRARLLDTPLTRDEGEYAYAGQLMLQGVAPYTLACNIKLPGTNACYAAMMAVFGQTATGIHFGFLLVNLATMWLVFCLARRLIVGPGVLVCCASYIVLSLSPVLLSLEGYAEHLVMLAALGGLLLLLKARENGGGGKMILSGLLFGMAFLCKQPGLFFGFLGGAILLSDTLAVQATPWRLRLRPPLLFSLGFALPLALTCLIMWWAGTFAKFWFWTVTFAQVHGHSMPADFGVRNFLVFFSADIECWFFVAGGAALACLWMEPDAHGRRFLLTSWYVLSWCSVMIGFYFMRHYYIFLLPVTCLLLGAGWSTLAALAGRVRGAVVSAVAIALFMAALGWVGWENRRIWFELPSKLACMVVYWDDPFIECLAVSQYIRENSAPGDRIAVVGSEPEIYFDAHRRSVSGYLYMYDLMDVQPYATAMQQEFIHDIESAKPEFLVVVNHHLSWTAWPHSDRTIFRWAREYPAQYYHLVGIAAMYPTYSEYFWGKEAETAEVKTPSAVYVFKRK
jgi:hypothetical protein